MGSEMTLGSCSSGSSGCEISISGTLGLSVESCGSGSEELEKAFLESGRYV